MLDKDSGSLLFMWKQHFYSLTPVRCTAVTHSGEESGVRLDMSSWVGTVEMEVTELGRWKVISFRFPLINAVFLLSSYIICRNCARKDPSVCLVFPLSAISDLINIQSVSVSVIWSHHGSVQLVRRDLMTLSKQLQENYPN